MNSPEVERAVANRMAHQKALITREQALAAGLTDAQIRARVDSERWVRLTKGLYRLAGAEVTWYQRALAPCLAAGPRAVVSHRSAPVVWGLSCIRPGSIEILVPDGYSTRSQLAIVHRTIELPRRDVTRRHGIPVTRPARMLVDLAAVVGPSTLEDVVDEILCGRLASLDEVRRRLDDLSTPGRATEALEVALKPWVDGPLPGSVAEMRAVRELLDHDLPRPERQFVIRDERGRFLAQVDLAYPPQRIAIEIDSRRWHGIPRALAKDPVRQARIRAMGWTLIWAEPGESLWDRVADAFRAATAA